jgi:hypothetical protein
MLFIDFYKISLSDVLAKVGGIWKIITSIFFLFSGFIFNIFIGELV